jgi:hypothetical protein
LAAAGAGALAITSFVAHPRSAGASAPTPGPLVRASSLAAPRVPAGSVDVGPVSLIARVSIQVVLDPSDPAGIGRLLAGLYDPSSSGYHRWLTPAQFAARFGPAASTVSEVTTWMRQRGLSARRTSTFAITVDASASAIDRALGTAFHGYRTRAGASGLVAAGAPLVPSDLESRVSVINGLSTLPAFTNSYHPVKPKKPAVAPRPIAGSATVGSACSAATNFDPTAYTMDKLTAAYGINSLRSAGLTGTGQTVAVYELAPSRSSDIRAYLSCFHLGNTESAVTVGRAPQADVNGTAEADLDIEQVATQAPGAAIVSYESRDDTADAYNLWNTIITTSPAKVISTSWGECEADAAQAGDIGGSDPYGPLFADAAAQGKTVLAASGDSGSEDCAAADYGFTSYWNSLAVDYPASDPNVTGVGGTDYYGAGNETPWNDCYGQSRPLSCAQNAGFQAAAGGGVSAYETRPSWQPLAAAAAGCTTGCREVPDISANAGKPMIFFDSDFLQGTNPGWAEGGGTSFAAPLVAGLVADRNQGCSTPSGDLARTLYPLAATAAGAQDGFQVPTGSVTVGGNTYSAADNDMLGANHGAYPVTAGYNLATGLGTPDAPGLSCAEVESVSPASGNAGDTVTVTGMGLEDATVYFVSGDGTRVPATVVSATSTSATVIAPAAADLTGAATVEGSYSGGDGRVTSTFTYPGIAPGPPPTTTSTTSTTTPVPPPPPPKPVNCPSTAGRRLGGAVGIASVRISGCDGYFVVDSAGHVSAFGAATSHGDLTGLRLSAAIIAVQSTPDGKGYWMLGADGGVFTFGDARFFGSTGGRRLNAPVVGMAATPDNRGYWIVARDGGVFDFGDARFYGSTGSLRLNSAVDGIAVAPGGRGYWLVASDGGVFAFTPDGFYGSLGRARLARPVVGMSSTPDGRGYTLVGSDGGVFSFGDAPFYGSLGGHPPATPVVDLSPTPGDNGYYLVAAGGAVYAFGPGARYFGSV